MNDQSATVPGSMKSKLLMVGVPHGESLTSSSELVPWLERGWQVVEACPRVTEDGAKYLVVLARKMLTRASGSTASSTVN